MTQLVHKINVNWVNSGDGQCLTRFEPNRVAADIRGNGEFDFLVIYEDFCRNFVEIGSLLEV